MISSYQNESAVVSILLKSANENCGCAALTRASAPKNPRSSNSLANGLALRLVLEHALHRTP